jgi:hypothetical protein
MRTVYKYFLNPDITVLALPYGAEVLSVHEQHEQVCLWALVDPDPINGTVDRKFKTVGTGHDITETNLQFIGSVHLIGGALVFHVFEVAA